MKSGIARNIVAELRLVDGNRQLIERMEQKIAGALARIWGEEECTEAQAAAAAV